MTFSNPAEVAKTRMQLQGELAKHGGVKVYRNVFDVFGKTWRNEGIRGIQRGLPPAVSDFFFSFLELTIWNILTSAFLVHVSSEDHDSFFTSSPNLILDSSQILLNGSRLGKMTFERVEYCVLMLG